eukprot:c25455_g1_i3 orf=438-1466(-)
MIHVGEVLGRNEITSLEKVDEGMAAVSGEQTEVVTSDRLQLVGLLTELREGLDELRNKMEPLQKKVKEGCYATKDGISYLEAKHMLLLCYCQSIVFYILLKAEGRSVRDHPVISRFIEIRLFLEKIRPIDKKLRYQIDKLLKLAKGTPLITEENGSGLAFESKNGLRYKPNPDMLVPKVDPHAVETGGVYRPPLIAPTAMAEEKTRNRKLKSWEEKVSLQRASRSAFIKELANELEGRPEEVKEIIGTESKEVLREKERLEARAWQEEQLFTRVPLTKSEKQKLKHLKRSRNGLMGMLDDFDDDIADLVGMEDDQPATTLKKEKIAQAVSEVGKRLKKPKFH